MMEGAFYERKKTSPTALAVVVLMHGAALTALALAKGEAIREAIGNPKVYHIDEVKPPPEEKPRPVEKAVNPPPRSVVTHVPPVVPPPPMPDSFAVSEPLPPKSAPIAGPEPVAEPVLPRIDPPVEAPRTVEPARARANLASYVSDEDYPSNAVRNEEQGTTRFKLVVGPDGKVKDCTVTSSSGSSALDSTTCRLMRQRARFSPARNNRGEATIDTVSNAIRWVLPAD